MDAFLRDFQFGVRLLRKTPAYTLTAITTLALCIGANTAVFSVVDAVLFRPLPYPQADRLLWISTIARTPQGEFEDTSLDGRTWEYLRDHARTMAIGVYSAISRNVVLAAPGGGAQYVKQQRVSAGFFRVLGASPLHGREVQPDEDRPGGPAVAVLSDSLWRRLFNADSSIVGRKILLRGEPYTVTGVMPPGFDSVPSAEVWTPLRPSHTGEGSGDNYAVLARVRPEMRRPDAEAEITALGASYYAGLPQRPGVSRWLRLIPVQRGLADLAGGARIPLLLLWAAVGLVLLIGCVNIASLELARGEARRHEIATRLALGGMRGAILRQLLAESLAIAIAGTALGLGAGYATLQASRGMLESIAGDLPDARLLNQPVALDGRVLAVTAICALLATLLFGLYPAFEASRLDLRRALASSIYRWGSRATTARRAWPRRGLVVCEIALGTLLLVGAGLVARSLAHFIALKPGFDGRQVFTASLSLQDARYSTSAQVNRLFRESLRRMREYPGVEAAGVALTLPYERPLNDGVRVVDGPHPMDQRLAIPVTYATPGFFEALRFALLRGRTFEERDSELSRPVAVVNEAFVRRYLRDSDPLGRHVALGGRAVEIVGVVGDVQQRGYGGGAVSPIPQIYIPPEQFPSGEFQMVHEWFSPRWVVRAAGTRAEIAGMMRKAMAATDPTLPFAEFSSMDEIQSGAFGMERLETILLGSLAALALLLSSVGIYGLIAHSVADRTREFGIRLALGSSRWRAVTMAARSGIGLAAAGVAGGLFLSQASGKLLRALISGVPLNDPTTLTAVAAILLGSAALAALIPALRIARIDPAVALREE
jgi:predicted permease